MPVPLNRKRHIVRVCKGHKLSIQPKALQILNDFFEGNALEELDAFLDRLPKGTQIVTADVVEQVIRNEVGTEKEEFQLINAFETPTLVYQVMRKRFSVDSERKPLFGSAEDKVRDIETIQDLRWCTATWGQTLFLTRSFFQVNRMAQRYALIHQRLMRNDLFRTNDLHNKRKVQHRIAPVESLIGHASDDEKILLLGIISETDEKVFHLEDPTGSIRVSFAQAQKMGSFFLTEHNIVLATGFVHEDVFYIDEIGNPFWEERSISLKAIQQHVSHPLFNHSNLPEDDAPMVLLSDVHLDQPRTLQQLEGLLASYEPFAAHALPLFVFMGNFCSQPSQLDQVRQGLDQLALLIHRFQNLRDNAHFVLVPGPNDGVTPVLPYVPLKSRNLQHRVKNVHFASNPCRLRWKGQETTIFRYDLLSLFQQRQIRLPEKTDPGEHLEAHCRMIRTILDQGHLIPISNVPVFWNFDHTLRLYPLPDTLVLGGDNAEAYSEVYGGCRVIHPGTFLDGGSYAEFAPSNDLLDYENDDEVLEDAEDSIVTFRKIVGDAN